MKLVSVETPEKSVCKMTFSATAEELEAASNAVYERTRASYTIKGFAKGEADRAQIEADRGEHTFWYDAINDLMDRDVPALYDAAMQEHGFHAVDEPSYDLVSVKKDEGFVATATTALQPELKLAQTTGFQSECVTPAVTDKEIDAVLERVAAIRESCGKYFGIAIDFHGRVHKPMAKVLAKKLEEFDPMFIEEPVLCENMEVFKEIAACCNVPIATGERLFTKYDFKRLLQAGGVDIIQPDLSHAGGLTEVKKIAAMAEAYDVALAPHCPLGPIALASCLNVDATCYNAVIQEQSIGIHYNVGKSVLDYVHNQEDFKFVDGRVALPVKPGLGVEVNKELVLEENKHPHEWKNPVWRHGDGSVAEW